MQGKIKIELLADNSYARISCNRERLYKVAQLISLIHERARYTTSYKLGNWDGRINYMNTDRTFLMGLVPKVYNYCLRKFKVRPIIIDHRQSVPIVGAISRKIATKIMRDYQVDVIKDCIKARLHRTKFQRGIIYAATNAGKSLMSISITKVIGKNARVLFLCPKYEVLMQVKEEYSAAFNEPIGTMTSKEMDLQRITVALMPTLYARRHTDEVREILKHFNCLFVDEAKHAPSASWSYIIEHSSAYFKFGLSGTALKAAPSRNMQTEALFGPVLHRITNKELVDGGYSALPSIKFISYNKKLLLHDAVLVDLTLRIKKLQSAVYYAQHEENKAKELALTRRLRKLRLERYARVYKIGVVRNIKRNKKIVMYLKQHKGKSCLIVVKEKEHGRKILDIMYKNGLKGTFISGDDAPEKRECIRKKFKAGKIKTVISTFVWKEGINVPNIDVLFYVIGGKSPDEVLQFFGRLLRITKTKVVVIVYDFNDVWDDNAKRHTKQRMDIYRKEGFTIEII